VGLGPGKEEGVIRTDDLFLCALALSRGGLLAGVEVEGINGRAVAFFHIDGADDRIEHDYYHGPAVVHLQLLKAAVQRLKNAAFDAIREKERTHAASTDQPGADRRYQAPGRYRRGDR
jgi:hypothetical protein